jgi:hypothetical protein
MTCASSVASATAAGEAATSALLLVRGAMWQGQGKWSEIPPTAFDVPNMVDGYEAVYRRAIARTAAAAV